MNVLSGTVRLRDRKRVCACVCELPVSFFFMWNLPMDHQLLYGQALSNDTLKSVRLNFKCAACVRHQALLGADGSSHKGQFHTG